MRNWTMALSALVITLGLAGALPVYAVGDAIPPLYVEPAPTPAPLQMTWQAPSLAKALAQSGAPLTRKLGDLSSKWFVFSISSGGGNPYADMITNMMVGQWSDEFSNGDTITVGSDVFLLVYKPEISKPLDFTSMMSEKGTKGPALTAETVLRLSLVNIHNVSAFDGIRAFNLQNEVAAGKKAADKLSGLPGAQKAASFTTSTMLAAGSMAPDFTVHDARGKAVTLSSYRGNVVVLDFWLTWDGPCQELLLSTNSFAAKYAKKGVVVLAVNVWDTRSAFKNWLPKHKQLSSIKVAIDPTGNSKDVASTLYHVADIPAQFVIDANGKIVKSIDGFSGDDNELMAGVKAALSAR